MVNLHKHAIDNTTYMHTHYIKSAWLWCITLPFICFNYWQVCKWLLYMEIQIVLVCKKHMHAVLKLS